MPVLVNDIIRFTNHYAQNGNTAQMVSYWQVNEVTEAAPDEIVARAFHELQMASIRVGAFMHSTGFATRTVMDNMTRPLEFGDWSGNIGGQAGGDPAPPFVSILIRQTRTNKATRNGYKRLPFVSENVMNGLNIVFPAGSQAGVQAWFGTEALLTGVFGTEPIDIRLVPVIVGRTEVSPGNYVPDITKLNLVANAIALRPTSQNSRKPDV